MLVPGELGFRVAVVLIFVVFPVFGLFLRRKWRLEVAKGEINRLIVLAGEEDDQAYIDTNISFFAAETAPLKPPTRAVVPRSRVCAVCFTPTSNRCSRCKSVHYCSGKCQIVDWRQGHKDECYPSPANSEINDEASSFSGNALNQPYSDEHGTQIDIDGLPGDEHGETAAFSSPYISAKDGDAAIDSNVCVEESHPFSVHHNSAVSFRLPPAFPGRDTCINDSSSDDDSVHNLISESCDSSSTFENFETATSDGQMEQINPLEEKSYMKSYTRVDSAGGVYASHDLRDDNPSGKIHSSSLRVSHSVTNVVEPTVSTTGFWDGILDTSRTTTYVPNNNVKHKPVGAGPEKLPNLKSTVQSDTVHNNPRAAWTSNKESAAAIRRQNSTFLSSKEPGTRTTGANERHVKFNLVSDTSVGISLPSSSPRANDLENNNHDTQPSLASQKAGFSPEQSDVFSSSDLKWHSALATKPEKAVGNAALPSQVARSTESASIGRKSSMLKVVEQLRAPRSSKQGDGAVNDGKKAVVAYDSFVKLYHWNKVDFLPCGLINCGNSCYANAVLQCLTFTPPLTAYFLQGLHSKACVRKEWCFTCEFERLVLKAKEFGYPQSPIGILSQIHKLGSRLTNGREEDAHEFLRYAIETMQSICLREAEVKDFSSLEEETTLTGLTFGGYLRSKIKCTRCNGKSVKQERMMDLTVEIEGDIETLEDALRQFTRTESLDGENKYHCGRCQSYEKAKKKLDILEAPNILTIALKRFQSGRFGKLNKSIRFPEILNLAPYMRIGSDKAPVYRLYGAVVHLDTMNASFTGHYVCYVRNAQNKWFKIDDSTVKPVDLDEVLNMGAYMLFYSRCSPRAPKSIRSMISRDLSSKITNKVNLAYIPRDETRHPLPNILEADSSSDNSSVFSHSDVSTSTDSSRESNSTDEFSEFFFGNNGFSRSSDLDTSSSSSSSSSPLYMKRSPLSNSKRYASAFPEHNVLQTDNGKAHNEPCGVTFLNSNSSSQVRNARVVNISGSEIDAKRLGMANPLDNGKSGVHLRRSSRRKPD
ncbi:ubiquitin carboxyl-terminal hydrolase 16 [Silene latifolia]|uniref:ubiquitin carboxyl-terminal hydrolase 16 n=1 Tax=Silene latifolia TaxID=37657 RepID=UPI003D77B087